MLKSIEQLVEQGFAIHWLHPKQKRPIGDDWSEKPVATVEGLKKSWRPGNNVGVRLGKWSKINDEFLHVIDMDIRDAKLAKFARKALSDLFPDWKTYPTVISGSGGESRHFYILCDQAFSSKTLVHSDEKWIDDKGKPHWAWEIELFGTGKQVAMPPSIHPVTDQPYVWQTEFNFFDVDLGAGPSVSSDRMKVLIGDDDEEEFEPDNESQQPLGLSADEVAKLLAKIPNDHLEYDEWLNVMASVQHEAFGRSKEERKLFYAAFRKWSSKSEKHDEGTTKYKFFSFKNKGNRRNRTMRSVQAEVRNIELEAEFENLEDEIDDLDEEVDGIDSDDFEDLLGSSDEEPVLSKREQKIKRAEVEAELGNVPPKIKRLNKKHAVAFVNGKTVIITENSDGSCSYGSQNELHAWYENDRVATEKATEPVSKAWMRHKKRREFPNGIVFAPGSDPVGAYNHWRGFCVEPEGDERGCRLILWHLKNVICSGKEKHYRYLLGWFAHMIQRPDEKPGVAVVLRGKKRIGKDTIAVYVGSLFPHNHIAIASQDQLTGKFNQHQEKCLLLNVQEGFWAGNKQAEGQLKYLITSEKVFIEPKGLNGFTVDSFLRLFITSNERWVVPATADEGRYFVLDVSDAKKDNHAYFAAISNEMKNGGKAALLKYLQTYDLDGYNVRDVPDSAALGQQKAEGLKNLDRWWFSMLESGELDFACFSERGGKQGDWLTESVMVDRDDFRESYQRWLRGRRYDNDELPDFQIGKKLKELLPEIINRRKRVDGKQIWTYIFPPVQECRTAFENFLKSELIWEDIQPVIIEHGEDEEFDDLDDI